jgi:hypothetical protein
VWRLGLEVGESDMNGLVYIGWAGGLLGCKHWERANKIIHCRAPRCSTLAMGNINLHC